MIDPTHITNFNQTDKQLEEVLIFWVLVAGKVAKTTAKVLENTLSVLKGSFSFEKFRLVGKEHVIRKDAPFVVVKGLVVIVKGMIKHSLDGPEFGQAKPRLNIWMWI